LFIISKIKTLGIENNNPWRDFNESGQILQKYQRTHSKQNEQNIAPTIDLSIAQAAGILALAFATGILSGCLLKRLR